MRGNVRPKLYSLNEELSVISESLTANLHFYCVFVDCVNSELVMRNMIQSKRATVRFVLGFFLLLQQDDFHQTDPQTFILHGQSDLRV